MLNKLKIKFMKILIASIFLLIGLTGFSQISGDIRDADRALLTETNYTLESTHNGTVTIDISIDIEGNITSARIVSDKTTVKSTPAKMKALNYVKKFEFQKGTAYPKYHQGRVVLHLIKPL